jgi:hypothetical protein
VFAVSIHDFLSTLDRWGRNRVAAATDANGTLYADQEYYVRQRSEEVPPAMLLRTLAATLRRAVEGILLGMQPDRDMALLRLPIAQVGTESASANGQQGA